MFGDFFPIVRSFLLKFRPHLFYLPTDAWPLEGSGIDIDSALQIQSEGQEGPNPCNDNTMRFSLKSYDLIQNIFKAVHGNITVMI